MINHLLIYFCEAYIDDVIVHSDTFQEHLLHIKALFVKLSNTNLTVSLMKTEFCHAVVEYFGHIAGNGHVRPVFAKVNAILKARSLFRKWTLRNPDQNPWEFACDHRSP